MEILLGKNEQVAVTEKGNGIKSVLISTGHAKARLSTLKEKDKFIIGDKVFRVLEQSGDTVAVIFERFLHEDKNVSFGPSNDYKESTIRKYLNTKILKELENAIGAENIVEHTVDLTSVDGLDDYGQCRDKVSLITFDRYRKYRKLLDNMSDWWWTATPWSTPSSDYSRNVCCVHVCGTVYYFGCGVAVACVRPFCIFKSNIFVSLENE